MRVLASKLFGMPKDRARDSNRFVKCETSNDIGWSITAMGEPVCKPGAEPQLRSLRLTFRLLRRRSRSRYPSTGRLSVNRSHATGHARGFLPDPLTMASSSSWRIDVASGIALTPIIPRDELPFDSDALPRELIKLNCEKSYGPSIAFGCDWHRSLTAAWRARDPKATGI